MCSFSLHILTCVHTGQLLPWQNRGISSYISFGFWYGGKGIQCWSFKLFLTLIICILFDIENVKFSKKIVVTCVLYNLFTPVFILFCTLCIFVNRCENCIKFKIFIVWVKLCKQVELIEYWMSTYVYRQSSSEQHYKTVFVICVISFYKFLF